LTFAPKGKHREGGTGAELPRGLLLGEDLGCRFRLDKGAWGHNSHRHMKRCPANVRKAKNQTPTRTARGGGKDVTKFEETLAKAKTLL
jgi:hypothetical protein